MLHIHFNYACASTSVLSQILAILHAHVLGYIHQSKMYGVAICV